MNKEIRNFKIKRLIEVILAAYGIILLCVISIMLEILPLSIWFISLYVMLLSSFILVFLPYRYYKTKAMRNLRKILGFYGPIILGTAIIICHWDLSVIILKCIKDMVISWFS